MTVETYDDFAPEEELHIDLELTSGPMPEAIRLWIGTESGEGSMKTKAEMDGNNSHVHVTCPATITDATALWIEVKDANGQRSAVSVPRS